MAIYLTHGAKKNVGDYLIHSRARKLWEHLSPETQVTSIPRWDKSALPADAKSLILCGGPGFTTKMIESVFPVAQTAIANEIPISGLALGWQGMPSRDPGGFAMTARSVSSLRKVTESGTPISVRDDVTQTVARQFGIETIRTGCTAWYSIPHLGKAPAESHPEPRTIVFTTPARTSNSREALSVMRLLRKKFPNARLIASFHRGIAKDSQTTSQQSRLLRLQAIVARTLGFEVRDVSYGLEKIGFYREVDLHIGYRVHAHLDFVSRRMPSILISEDGRGYGQTATLHGEDQVLWAGGKNVVADLNKQISNETENGWPSLTRAVETIESSFPIMRKVILQQGQI